MEVGLGVQVRQQLEVQGDAGSQGHTSPGSRLPGSRAPSPRASHALCESPQSPSSLEPREHFSDALLNDRPHCLPVDPHGTRLFESFLS